MNIVLRSGPLVVKTVLKKTTAKLFKDLKVGNRIELFVRLEAAGSRRGRTYSTYIKVMNLDTEEVVSKSFNELPKLLDNFELQEL